MSSPIRCNAPARHGHTVLLTSTIASICSMCVGNAPRLVRRQVARALCTAGLFRRNSDSPGACNFHHASFWKAHRIPGFSTRRISCESRLSARRSSTNSNAPRCSASVRKVHACPMKPARQGKLVGPRLCAGKGVSRRRQEDRWSQTPHCGRPGRAVANDRSDSRRQSLRPAEGDGQAAYLQFVFKMVRRDGQRQKSVEVLPCRRVVERTFGWMIRWRRPVCDCERRNDVSITMIRPLWAAFRPAQTLIPDLPNRL